MPDGLMKRGKYWHIRTTIDGVRYKKSTKRSNRSEAEAVLKRFIAETRAHAYLGKWEDHVVELVENKQSWLYQTIWSTKRRNIARKHGTNGVEEETMISILVRSRGLCEVTGLPFEYGAESQGSPYRYSVDRINSDIGYSRENTRVVCLAVNIAMNKWGEAVLRRIGKAITLQELRSDPDLRGTEHK